MENKDLNLEKLKGISALLVHAAKIDEDYSGKEKNIILNFLNNFTPDKAIKEKILKEAELLESDSNQILDFTNTIKKDSIESKSIVVKELWKIIISNNETDEYESNLMRRVCGLIYFPDKLSGEIKLKLKEELKN
ncbi:TerB family tellurite resistance protein [Pelagibacteraceae bacterium]|jgi:uncharacterized tellurite resistance protein B-like protein|nr:TerB family tellurite resistance protein [Pelagibacteraceae bacterium]